MWVLKLKLDSTKQLLGQIAINNNITMSGYPLSSSEKKDHLKVITCGLMFGTQDNKEKLLKKLKANKLVVDYENNNDFVIIQIKTPKFMKPFFNPEVIHVSPVLIDPDNKKHTWTLASFKRELLEEIYAFSKEKLNAKLLKFKEEKIDNISITSIMPSLSKKQHEAFNLAIINGYYKFPKETDMKSLAKLMKISYSTFQEHLKKAESKLMISLTK